MLERTGMSAYGEVVCGEFVFWIDVCDSCTDYKYQIHSSSSWSGKELQYGHGALLQDDRTSQMEAIFSTHLSILVMG